MIGTSTKGSLKRPRFSVARPSAVGRQRRASFRRLRGLAGAGAAWGAGGESATSPPPPDSGYRRVDRSSWKEYGQTLDFIEAEKLSLYHPTFKAQLAPQGTRGRKAPPTSAAMSGQKALTEAKNKDK